MANQTQQLAKLLQGEGLTVSLVQTNVSYRPQCVSGLPIIRALLRLFPYCYALWQLAGRCDVIHVMANSGWSWHLFAAPAVWMAKLRGVPAVINYRGGEADAFLAKSARSVRISMRQAAALIVPSEFLKAVFARFGMTASIVPNIVDLAHFTNPAPHRTARRHLLVARNLEPIYGIDIALRAFAVVAAQLPAARLSIAGSGPLRQELEQLAATLGVSPRKAGQLLCRQRATILYRRQRLDAHFSLTDHPIAIRLAGLDRDPGWMPSTGYDVRFFYDHNG